MQVVALGLASQSSSAKIVAATDGLSNIGIGALDSTSAESLIASSAVYQQVGLHAKEHAITISVISIKGEGCNLQFLGQMADTTGGVVQIVDPLLLRENFANVLANRLIATKCSVSVILHRGMRFLNEGDAKQRASRDVGNVFADSEVSFEFGLNPDADLKGAPAELPFQVQIVYSKLNGMKCIRVLTEMRRTTSNIAQVEQELNINLLSNNAFYQGAKLAEQGQIEAAVQRTSAVSGYVQSVAASNPIYQPQADAVMRHQERWSSVMATEQAAQPQAPGGVRRLPSRRHTNLSCRHSPLLLTAASPTHPTQTLILCTQTQRGTLSPRYSPLTCQRNDLRIQVLGQSPLQVSTCDDDYCAMPAIAPACGSDSARYALYTILA